MTTEPALGIPPLGIYVHWPFCASKCPYCDFNSHVRASIDQSRWRAALLAELDHFARDVPGRAVASVFFGGGTPSLMAPQTVAAAIDRIGAHWRTAPDLEITLEANPGSVEAGRFADYRAAGVNRVSLGVQSLRDDALRFLGRAHDAGEARAAIALAARTFPRFSFDLIYARPGQTPAAWEAELREALTLAGEHLSAYQLTIEAGTAFHTLHARGDLPLPPEDDADAMFELTEAVLGAAGLPAYEVSNHARPGAACRHNLIYWRSDDYLGIGPGAHGRITIGGTRFATRQARAPETWLARIDADGHATEERTALDRETRIDECLMMGLRLSDGIDAARFRRVTGLSFDDALDAARLRRLIEGGFLVRDAAGLRATRAGRKVLNAVLAELRG